jgi:hypothetical protein
MKQINHQSLILEKHGQPLSSLRCPKSVEAVAYISVTIRHTCSHGEALFVVSEEHIESFA